MMPDPSVHAKGGGGGGGGGGGEGGGARDRGQNLVFLHTLFFLIDYFVW